VSGGAPRGRDLAEFFADLGVMIYEGYGLTETSPVIAVNREETWKFGSVGVPLDGVEVRIAEDGEIQTRGPSVMKGYFGKPDETAAALEGGWFHTGDLGRLDKDRCLWITGRKKELIVTSGGKKVSPRPIEEAFEADPFITRCVLYGEGRKFITALLVPDRARLLEHAAAAKLETSDYAALLRDPAIRQFYERRIEELSKDLAGFERVKYFALLENDFTQAAGELTPTLKVKREVVLGRYGGLLEPFYAGDAG
jgi:long-chain acyl-CoA synthetase